MHILHLLMFSLNRSKDLRIASDIHVSFFPFKFETSFVYSFFSRYQVGMPISSASEYHASLEAQRHHAVTSGYHQTGNNIFF